MDKLPVPKLYDAHYTDYILSTCDTTKYEWAASEIFDLCTYDGDLDERFVKTILEVCKIILENRNYEAIRDDNFYPKFIIVCNLLDHKKWIDWGSSIRGAWFQEDRDNKPILQYNIKEYGYDSDILPFSIDNLKALIDFIEKEEKENA